MIYGNEEERYQQKMYLTILSVSAFLLGACPFSVWIGRIAMHKDIRKYGDGNPGSTNVFRAGSIRWGIVAVILDMIKGMPFIILAKHVYMLGQPDIYIIALAAVLGHAFSPFLGFRGGKALAVFGGTLLALEQWDLVICMMLLLIIGFLFIGNDSITTMFATAGGLCYMLVAQKNLWEICFIACISVLFLYKHYRDLRLSRPPGRLVNWVRSRRKPV